MLLKIGSNGEDVKKLQEKLGLIADGDFGVNTETAVKTWQKNNGLSADGVVGDITWKKMFSVVLVEELNLSRLKGIIPDKVINEIPETAKRFNITNNLRLSHFLAQCSVESGNFVAVLENLNYSSDGLKRVFPRYFPDNLSESYARQPEKIANRVYGSRLGNGDELSGEGYKYRGRGYLQLTGKSNYEAFSKFIGEDCVANPDLVATKYPLASVGFFFNTYKAWDICDLGSDVNTVTLVSKRVNGGTNGLEERIKKFAYFYNILK